MIRRVTIKGLKGEFPKILKIDFTSNFKDYNFNEDVIVDGIVKTPVLVGTTLSGKTSIANLLAPYSTTSFLGEYLPNAKSYYTQDDTITLKCEFVTKAKEVIVYECTSYVMRRDIELNRLYESIKLNGKRIFEYKNERVYVAKEYRKEDQKELTYGDKEVLPFSHKVKLLSINMNPLWPSLDFSKYDEDTIRNLNIFLKEFDIDYEVKNSDDWKDLSKAIRLLTYYYHYLYVDDLDTLIIDDFSQSLDIFISYELLKKIIDIRDRQVIVISDNGALLSNDLSRPDCLYLIQKGKVDKLDSLTNKDLQFAHNLYRMWRAGFFFD